jgi:hypothetical protein
MNDSVRDPNLKSEGFLPIHGAVSEERCRRAYFPDLVCGLCGTVSLPRFPSPLAGEGGPRRLAAGPDGDGEGGPGREAARAGWGLTSQTLFAASGERFFSAVAAARRAAG